MSAGLTSTDAGVLHHPRLTLLPSDDQREMSEAVRSFLATVVPAPSADAPGWAGIDPTGALWRRMAQELGLQGLTVPESLGGQGFGIAEAAMAFEELGRSLCSAPLLGCIGLAGRALHHAGPAGGEFLAALSTGELRATAALDSASAVRATDGNEPTLTGEVIPLIDGIDVGLVVVAAQHPRGIGLYLVDPADPGVELTSVTAIDLSRGFARLALTNAQARILSQPGDAQGVIDRARHECIVLLAAESVGAARRALESAVDYSRTREQFGRPIGSFQALKHRMADILISIEGAWSSVRHAAALADLVDERADLSLHDLALAASVAKVAADTAVSFASAECIQIHGGIGFTWEYPAHLTYRRAVANNQLLGSTTEHRDAIVALLTHRRG